MLYNLLFNTFGVPIILVVTAMMYSITRTNSDERCYTYTMNSVYIKRESDELLVVGDGWMYTVGIWYFDVLYVLCVLGERSVDMVECVDTLLRSRGRNGDSTGNNDNNRENSRENSREKENSRENDRNNDKENSKEDNTDKDKENNTNATDNNNNTNINTPYLQHLPPFSKFIKTIILCQSLPFKISFTAHHLLLYNTYSAYVPYRIYTLRNARTPLRIRNMNDVVKEIHNRMDVLEYADDCTINSLGVFIKNGYLDDMVIYVFDGDIVVFECSNGNMDDVVDDEVDDEVKDDKVEDGRVDDEIKDKVDDNQVEDDKLKDDNQVEDDKLKDDNQVKDDKLKDDNQVKDDKLKDDNQVKDDKLKDALNSNKNNNSTDQYLNHYLNQHHITYKQMKIKTCTTAQANIKIHIRCKNAIDGHLTLRKRGPVLFVRRGLKSIIMKMVPCTEDERWRSYCDSVGDCCGTLEKCGEDNEGVMYLKMIGVIKE
ncbi:hypothetical protein THOM_1324 [Trachipleistophora hominis]|uniref:Uncharacterized protein n=1 Tax=Trachipleistophora hominis TaxID=72359 RepID=L7JY49_TRAHO|nr:hypothetical protein THOM_1324 [Trachipleistophora hominis]